MNWSKAKNIIIVILVAVNIGLLFSSKYTSQNNRLSFEAQRAIVKLLNRNGIELSAELPKKISPMPQLGLINQVSNTDTDQLKTTFFGDEQDIKISVALGDTILKKDNKTLTIDGAQMDYTNIDNNSGIEGLDKATAKKISDQFVKTKLGKAYSDYKFFSITNDNSSYCVSYYENYKSYEIYSNYVKIYVTNKGIAVVKLFRYQPEHFDSVTRQICSADEALLTFMYQAIEQKDKSISVIDKMELGYILELGSQKSANAVAIPCYSVSVKDSNQVYYINAYTNTIIED
jgi:regulatory protein YycI of two-component signal transduction system YycFG